MDATQKPLLIPPEFSNYAEKHGIFNIYERLLKKLIIEQPVDPLDAIVNWLKEPEDLPNIFVIGPPGAGKRSICRELADELNCIYVCKDDLNSYTTDDELVNVLKERLSQKDCIEQGWVLEDIPGNRYQALQLQSKGIFPKKVVFLDAPNSVLIERVIGKRIDTLTGDVYHATFHPPKSIDILKRLKKDPTTTEPIMTQRLAEFYRTIGGVLQCYQNIFKVINADQPKTDVLSQALTYLSMKQRNDAPHTPRVVLLGPPGCGKSVQAALLASKYELINVDCDEYVKQVVAEKTDLGDSMRTYLERNINVPDELLLKALRNRLSQLDAIKRGWVLHGFPKTRNQVDAFSHSGFDPNRVIVLDIPSDTSAERLSLRAIDPVSGDRYHLLYNPPRTIEIKSRLKMHPNDEEHEVLRRYTDYKVQIEDILEFYLQAQHINADQDLQTVFECIETIIVNPLPGKCE